MTTADQSEVSSSDRVFEPDYLIVGVRPPREVLKFLNFFLSFILNITLC